MAYFKSYLLEFIHNVENSLPVTICQRQSLLYYLAQAIPPFWYVSAYPINLLVGNILILAIFCDNINQNRGTSPCSLRNLTQVFAALLVFLTLPSQQTCSIEGKQPYLLRPTALMVSVLSTAVCTKEINRLSHFASLLTGFWVFFKVYCSSFPTD